jgi:hypothetical protein
MADNLVRIFDLLGGNGEFNIGVETWLATEYSFLNLTNSTRDRRIV